MAQLEELFGMVLLLTGFGYFTIGATFLGKTGSKEVGVLCLGVIGLIKLAWPISTAEAANLTALVSIFFLIFSILAAVFIQGYDVKGFGWFCLFATIAFFWFAIDFFVTGGAWVWWGILCSAWAMSVFLAFFPFALGKTITPIVAWIFMIESILAFLIPGMLLLLGYWNPFTG